MVKGEGMPIYSDDPQNALDDVKRGDLIVRFDIIFPSALTETQKEELNELFEED